MVLGCCACYVKHTLIPIYEYLLHYSCFPTSYTSFDSPKLYATFLFSSLPNLCHNFHVYFLMKCLLYIYLKTLFRMQSGTNEESHNNNSLKLKPSYELVGIKLSSLPIRSLVEDVCAQKLLILVGDESHQQDTMKSDLPVRL